MLFKQMYDIVHVITVARYKVAIAEVQTQYEENEPFLLQQ